MNMKKNLTLVLLVVTFIFVAQYLYAEEKIDQKYPIGEPGRKLTYISIVNDLPESVIRKIELSVGAVEKKNGALYQWLRLAAEKGNKETFTVWILTSDYPAEVVKNATEEIIRYILSGSDGNTIEFINETNGKVILPNTGAWRHLLPRTENGNSPIELLRGKIKYLGHEYNLDSHKQSDIPSYPKQTLVVCLTPDLLIGVPHNSKVEKDERRWDESDYNYVTLTKSNYFEMIEHGINVFRVDSKQAKWIEYENVYIWGIGGKDVQYPECLYASNYIGPELFFDEPMVVTRDHILKPKFKEKPLFRKAINPKLYFEEFEKVYYDKKYVHGPTQFLKSLEMREDVDIGDMNFLQQNMYSWETMVSSASYQLTEGDNKTPAAMVFEPPVRFGAKRVLPELNMSFGCQIPADNPQNLIGIITGFLRGAARISDKEWGISIYGQVIRSEATWYFTNAYDQGATHFFFWDSYQLAAVPYNEYLIHSKNLRDHAKSFPHRNLSELKKTAETALVLPLGYNLGHVKMGIGNFGGLPELNMERKNNLGNKYREVMHNFYVEIERCIRLGIDYDLFWDLKKLDLSEYNEIIKISDDCKIEVNKNNSTQIFESARYPQRPDGIVPELAVDINMSKGNGKNIVTAVAKVKEGSAPIYYTLGADKNGVYNNHFVLWEMYGPNEEDYTDFWNERWNVKVTEQPNSASSIIKFEIKNPGTYRLRVSTSDLAGRSNVVWENIIIP